LENLGNSSRKFPGIGSKEFLSVKSQEFPQIGISPNLVNIFSGYFPKNSQELVTRNFSDRVMKS